MFPFPILYLTTSGGVIPIPAGSVKKIATMQYMSGTTYCESLAILLNDNRLFISGANVNGELGIGNTNQSYDKFVLANTSGAVTDVFAADRCFVVKYTSGGWQYAGNTAGLIGGSDAIVSTWTSLPSAITGTVTLANLVTVKGAPQGGTLWEMSTGTLYGSGDNGSGCLGPGNANDVTVPRVVTNANVKSMIMPNTCVYMSNVGQLRVSGWTSYILGNGTNTLINSFATATFTTGENPGYVKDFLADQSVSMVVGAASAGDTTNFLYVRGSIGATNYTKVPMFASGFSNYKTFYGSNSSYIGINGQLYGIGATSNAMGGGESGFPSTPIVPIVPSGSRWDLSKVAQIDKIYGSNWANGYAAGHLIIYDGNLFYTGTIGHLFNSAPSVSVFTQMPEGSFIGVKANSISTDSIGIAIKGGTKQLTYTVDPSDGALSAIAYTTSAPSIMTINSSGLMTFVAEGGFDAGMTAKNNEGTTLSDTSGGYVSTLGVYTESLSAMYEKATQQLIVEITPEGAATIPGMVVTYTTTDPTVATVDANGLITGVKDGTCRIGCTATYQGTVVASDSSYLAVNAIPMDIDLTQTALPAGVTGAANNTLYYRASGNVLTTEGSITTASLEYIGTTAQGRRISMLPTEQRALYNGTLAAAQWIKVNAVSQNFTTNSPAGTSTYVAKLTVTSVNGSHSLTSPNYTVPDFLVSGTTHTVSVFLKAAGLTKAILRVKGNTLTKDVTVDLTAGTVSGAGGRIIDMGNGWYRIMNTITLSANQTTLALSIVALNASGQEVYTGDDTNGLYVWLPQMEQASYATSPRVTTSFATGFGAVSLSIPRNAHTGVDVYYTNGQVVRVPFTGSGTSFQLPTDVQVGDWGSTFIKGMRYY